MKILVSVAIAAAVLAAGHRAARADDVVAYQADGDAAAGAANARVEALDEAFGKAVTQALGELVDADVRRQSKAVIDRELLGHARLWVTKFTVTKEAVADDRKQISVSVRVDRDKLRVRLAELNIALKAAGAGTTGGDALAAPAQTVVILLRTTTPDGMRATFGGDAEKEVVGLASLSSALRRANFAIKRAAKAGPAARADGELPLDDGEAEAMVGDTKADVLAIAGLTIGAPVPLRGIDASGVLVAAHVRLVDRRTHKPIGQGSVVTVARGSEQGLVVTAIDRALTAAVGDVIPAPAPELAQAQPFTGEDRPVGEPGIVLVRLARATPWGLVQSEIKHLVGARGVARATLRHVSPAGWVIGVATGESIDRIASIVKKPPVSDAQVAVKIVGDVVEATLSGAP